MAQTQQAQGGKQFRIKIGNNIATGAAVTFTDTGDLVTLNNHGLIAGQIVRFATVVTTTGISANTTYYVVAPTANTFQVAAIEGGVALALTSDGTGTMNEAFQTIAGLRTTSLSINSEEIDITNQDSNEWQERLDLSGVKSVALSGTCVFKDEGTYNYIQSLILSGGLRNYQVLINSAGDYWQGCFKITSLEMTGDYNNEQTFSLSLVSSGPVTLNRVP
jgi:TP901-1 family phage major tail protein